ncbi:hypothetical protein CHH75_24155 [Paenibacillus sp. 7541]|nr:hypothetical protein CHH75_24155 [Paenibacillus sp. 7541]
MFDVIGLNPNVRKVAVWVYSFAEIERIDTWFVKRFEIGYTSIWLAIMKIISKRTVFCTL